MEGIESFCEMQKMASIDFLKVKQFCCWKTKAIICGAARLVFLYLQMVDFSNFEAQPGMNRFFK